MPRILAHRIIYQNREYRNHIAELQPDGTIQLLPPTPTATTLQYQLLPQKD